MNTENETIDAETGEVTGPYEAPHASGEVPHVIWAMHAITTQFSEDGIAKAHRNEQQKYNFRGIDDVLNALSSEIADAKLIITPRFRKVIERSVHQTTKGGLMFSVVIEMDYEFKSALDGSVHVATVVSEGADYSDKATAKAMSNAYKYMAIQTFCIPTEGLSAEGDADYPTAQYSSVQASNQQADDHYNQRSGQNRPQQQARTDQAYGGRKSSSQSKKDGDWEYLTGSMRAQRTEESLEAWAHAHKSKIATLTRNWQNSLREEYAKHLDQVRKWEWEEMEKGGANGAPGPDVPF
jgi:hypothetical protein